jgi:beta-lactamase class A
MNLPRGRGKGLFFPGAGLAAVVLLLFLGTTAWTQAPEDTAPAPVDIPFQRLNEEIARAAEEAGGTVGMSAVHLESKRRVAFNSGERFPMASAYKIPLAVQIFFQIDRGAITLDQMVELKLNDLHPGSGVLTELFPKPGVILSVQNLLELMLLISDNTATDLLLRLAGGPEAVTARMREIGIREMEINRPTVNLIADSEGYTLPPETEWRPEIFPKLHEATPDETRKAAARNFERDPRDTSTPEAMVVLLERIYRGDLLQGESRALLLDMMERCRTGSSRLRGFLPSRTVVAHKTGTFAGISNDAGIITLPEGAGHVAMAVFVKSSEKKTAERDRAIAQMARAVYDFFLFRPWPPAGPGGMK